MKPQLNNSCSSEFPALCAIRKIPINQELSITLNERQEWVKDLLAELNEKVPDHRDKGHLTVELVLEKKSTAEYREHVIVSGQGVCEYFTECVRCLETMPDKVEFDFKTCFLSPHLKSDPELAESDTVLCNNEELDLYFSNNKNEVDLRELLYEQIVLSMNPFPLHEASCKGLCPQCGENRNLVQCGH